MQIRSLVQVLAMALFLYGCSAVAVENQQGIDDLKNAIRHMPDSVAAERNGIRYIRSIDSDLLPYMVGSLQDYRDVPEQSFEMIPGGGANRNMPARQVHISNVASLLMRLLEERTGESFGMYFYDFEVKNVDELSINKWRHWCELKYQSRAKICWNEVGGIREVVSPRKLNN